VDKVVAVVENALAKLGTSTKAVERWKEEMPKEAEMRPKDKYTIFDRKERGYRKGIHSEFPAFAASRLESWGCLEGSWTGLDWADVSDRTSKMDSSLPAGEPTRLLS
jgi:Mitochondrial ribosomal protein L31